MLPATYYSLLTTYYLLLTIYCLLLTTYYLLLTAYYSQECLEPWHYVEQGTCTLCPGRGTAAAKVVGVLFGLFTGLALLVWAVRRRPVLHKRINELVGRASGSVARLGLVARYCSTGAHTVQQEHPLPYCSKLTSRGWGGLRAIGPDLNPPRLTGVCSAAASRVQVSDASVIVDRRTRLDLATAAIQVPR